MCITTYQPDPKSNHSPNRIPTVLRIQINSYEAPFLQLTIVIVTVSDQLLRLASCGSVSVYGLTLNPETSSVHEPATPPPISPVWLLNISRQSYWCDELVLCNAPWNRTSWFAVVRVTTDLDWVTRCIWDLCGFLIQRYSLPIHPAEI